MSTRKPLGQKQTALLIIAVVAALCLTGGVIASAFSGAGGSDHSTFSTDSVVTQTPIAETTTPAQSPTPAAKPTTAKPSPTATPKPKATTTTKKPSPTPTKTTPKSYPTVSGAVHAGAFCSQHWDYGYTADHTLMRCNDDRDRLAFSVA